MIRYFVSVTPSEQLTGYRAKKITPEHAESHFLEGLRLLLNHRYLLGIFAITIFFELIATVLEFNFKSLAFAVFSHGEAANAYFGNYTSTVNLATFLCLILGINNINRWLGLRAALMLVPLYLEFSVTLFFYVPSS
jgi:AAA family ATP:ADP antiporter